jgi:uncharacterized protein (TIGR00730 family)
MLDRSNVSAHSASVMIRSVTVYLSSSSAVPKVYKDAAAELGRALALHHWTLVYGGNAVGLMGILADSVRAGGGRVVGVTPQVLVDKGITDNQCDELITTATMRERKAILESRADAFIALPGGLGTFEEIFEIIVGRVLGSHAKPVILLNIAGYYEPLLAMVDHGIEQGFIKGAQRTAFTVCPTVQAATQHLQSFHEAGSKPTEGAVQTAAEA